MERAVNSAKVDTDTLTAQAHRVTPVNVHAQRGITKCDCHAFSFLQTSSYCGWNIQYFLPSSAEEIKDFCNFNGTVGQFVRGSAFKRVRHQKFNSGLKCY